MTWETLVDAPRELVWRALTTTEGLATWLPGTTTLDLRGAGRLEMRLDAADQESYGGVIGELNSGQGLSFEIDHTPAGVDAVALRRTRWVVSLTAFQTDGTIVRVSVDRPSGEGRAAFWIMVRYETLMALWQLRSTFERAGTPGPADIGS